jgi:hypothetical protein
LPAAQCSQRVWPYYETACLRDPSRPDGRAHEVRFVEADRPAAPALAAQVTRISR